MNKVMVNNNMGKKPTTTSRRVKLVTILAWKGTLQQDLPRRMSIKWQGKLISLKLRQFNKDAQEMKELWITSIAAESDPQILHNIGVLVKVNIPGSATMLQSEECRLEEGEDIGDCLIHDYLSQNREIFLFEIIGAKKVDIEEPKEKEALKDLPKELQAIKELEQKREEKRGTK